MEDQLQKDEISLLDLFKVLWSKLKLLIVVFLCGGIIGGALLSASLGALYSASVTPEI